MDLKDLSSNWRKLQKTLRSTPRPLKRKANEDLHQRQHGKRRQAGGNVEAIQPGKRNLKRRVMEGEKVNEAPVAPTTIPDKANEGLSPTYACPLLDDSKIFRSRLASILYVLIPDCHTDHSCEQQRRSRQIPLPRLRNGRRRPHARPDIRPRPREPRKLPRRSSLRLVRETERVRHGLAHVDFWNPSFTHAERALAGGSTGDRSRLTLWEDSNWAWSEARSGDVDARASTAGYQRYKSASAIPEIGDGKDTGSKEVGERGLGVRYSSRGAFECRGCQGLYAVIPEREGCVRVRAREEVGYTYKVEAG